MVLTSGELQHHCAFSILLFWKILVHKQTEGTNSGGLSILWSCYHIYDSNTQLLAVLFTQREKVMDIWRLRLLFMAHPGCFLSQHVKGTFERRQWKWTSTINRLGQDDFSRLLFIFTKNLEADWASQELFHSSNLGPHYQDCILFFFLFFLS